ncbi:transposase family protein [Arthrobacter sp. W4I7]|uniref:transposase family protein n=1 Tax=Arthrobacter sp. W4I7 TaxID=3042296 RepID=UPI00358E78A4
MVHASTRGGALECPACGTLTRRVHAFQGRMLADVPVDGRRVLLRVLVRRMRCGHLAARGRPSGSRSRGRWSAISGARPG